MKKDKKKIVFITGTRADFGKIKSLISILNRDQFFDVYIFTTGMHMDPKYGYTINEIEKCKFPNIYRFKNYLGYDSMDYILAKTVSGFGNYIKKIKPDMIVIHGDRVEALAGALVGSLNNIFVCHIEGGEISGTIDESIRHAISKFAHLHFVANQRAKKRLLQMGENPKNIFVIGSPDLDIMNSKELPSLEKVKNKYEIYFDNFALALFHPVTTEIASLEMQTNIFVKTLLKSNVNYIVVYPNNDLGNEIILKIYNKKILNNKQFKVFPSLRFEYFLTFLKHSLFVIGNSSVGVKESPYYGVPSVDIGTRQNNRVAWNKESKAINHCDYKEKEILRLINKFSNKIIRYKSNKFFGKGNSSMKFYKILKSEKIWRINIQKKFLDIIF